MVQRMGSIFRNQNDCNNSIPLPQSECLRSYSIMFHLLVVLFLNVILIILGFLPPLVEDPHLVPSLNMAIGRKFHQIFTHGDFHAYREVLKALRKLINKKTALASAANGHTMEVVGIDSIEQTLPCRNRRPEVNNKEVKKYKPLVVKLGELYQSTLPASLFTDYVSYWEIQKHKNFHQFCKTVWSILL